MPKTRAAKSPRVMDLVEVADPADAFLGQAVRGRGQRSHVLQAQGVGQDVGDAPDGGVTVGVHGQQRGPGLDQAVHGLALGRVRGNGRDALEQQRVVGDEQLGAQVDGFLDDLEGGIDGEHDPRDLGGRMAGHEAHLVPVLGQRLRPELLHGQHGSAPASRRRRPRRRQYRRRGGSSAVGFR